MIDVLFVGSGDAFGSGGRFNTCFFVSSPTRRFLIDCGASSMIAIKQQGLDPNSIDTIFITHFHADHFGGIPFFMLDAQFFSKRTGPLTSADILLSTHLVDPLVPRLVRIRPPAHGTGTKGCLA